MKVVFGYLPIDENKGTPLISQNRQFQYFKEPTYIYPVVPASAATLLERNGFEVLWKDCIAENITVRGFYEFIKKEKPDLLAIETKTPVIKNNWQVINEIKKQGPGIKIVLCGDHVTALPEESLVNSGVDFVLTGGDYDFLLLNLCKVLKSGSPYSNFEPGIYYRDNDKIHNSGKFILNHNLDDLPLIDRELSKWKLYAYKNGNFKKTPGTYIMAGRDCWWGKCKFCSWPTLYPEFRARSPENVLSEINMLVTDYEVKEIMDDTGTFPVGKWLKEFCDGMIQKGLNKKVNLDCNMRFGVLNRDEYALMKKAGFRLVLFGLESAIQKTLDRIDKNLKVETIIESCRMARLAGLYPHITIMFGYPWETYKEALNTLELGRWLLIKGIAYTVQATIVIPYPGSKLYSECKANNELITNNWEDYDMKRPVMKTEMTEEQVMSLAHEMYKISFNPGFILKKMLSLRDMDDFRYYSRAARKVFGHLFDFKKGAA
jgi:radical SAM superfamily enzyme YgiQ (UPF0313 family)